MSTQLKHKKTTLDTNHIQQLAFAHFSSHTLFLPFLPLFLFLILLSSVTHVAYPPSAFFPPPHAATMCFTLVPSLTAKCHAGTCAAILETVRGCFRADAAFMLTLKSKRQTREAAVKPQNAALGRSTTTAVKGYGQMDALQVHYRGVMP